MTMANLQKLNPTQQELYNYLEQQTGQVNFEVLQPFTTQEMGTVLHISRNTVSQYLNEFFKEGWMVKINTRPVYYFLRETLSRKFNVQTLDAEYEDLQFLQQDLNHGRRADSCFAGVIGYHLSLKSAVEKCRVAVEYPPTGLPLVLAGEKGTGKRLLAGKTWSMQRKSRSCRQRAVLPSWTAPCGAQQSRAAPALPLRSNGGWRLAPAAIFCTCTALTSWRAVCRPRLCAF